MQARDGSFFGRRKGKALRPGQRAALARVLPALRIDISVPPPTPLERLFPVAVDDIAMEIGFGGGEHLLDEARRLPTTGFIGIEPFENGLAKAVAVIGREDIRNVRLFDRDATLLLDWLPAASLVSVDLLYPDPWPKRRHWKRRFVNASNLERLARCLTAGGCFRFASDVDDYVEWTLGEVARHGGFVLAADGRDRRQPWEGWPGTRYERKALAEGRRPSYLLFHKSG
jgi:tRNA (guanine-N7-)-methyltransferase